MVIEIKIKIVQKITFDIEDSEKKYQKIKRNIDFIHIFLAK